MEMYLEIIKYFQTDINNMINFINQTVIIKNQQQKAGNVVGVINCEKVIKYLIERTNFARNVISFLKQKINELKEEIKKNPK